MSRRLPPLNALRAFEAAGRHLSFTKAADELNVTPAAVSHQVKALEGYVGHPLFRRLTRALRLSDAGQAALPVLSEGFDRLEDAARHLRADGTGATLTVSAAPTFAARWLVHHLEDFRTAHPEIRVRIDASLLPVDFAREDVDVAVRFGLGRYPGLRVERLFEEELFPVCSPRLLEGPHPLRAPADLRHHTQLHVTWKAEDEAWPDWRMWLRAAGASGVEWSRGPEFSLEDMAIQTAIDGHGVALVNGRIVARDLAQGRLVKPFALTIPVDFGYFVVCPERTAEQPKVAAFREWIIARARSEAGTAP